LHESSSFALKLCVIEISWPQIKFVDHNLDKSCSRDGEDRARNAKK
jgi:hypothetical protein